MKERIKLNRICSSCNYEQTHRTRKSVLEENHNKNKEYLDSVLLMTISNKKDNRKGKRAFTMCGGKEIEVPYNIAINMSSDINLIWK